MSKYGHKPHNWFEAIVNKLGGEEAAERFLRNEVTVSKPTRSWREEDGVIYFWVTSDGTTGPQWIKRLEGKGFRLSKWAKDILRSPDFKPTTGVTTEGAVLKGALFKDKNRVTWKIRLEADRRGLIKLNVEVACLIRELFTDEEIKTMGLWWIVTMHEPIKDSGGDPGLLAPSRDVDGQWLHACSARLDGEWSVEYGFAFVVSQVST